MKRNWLVFIIFSFFISAGFTIIPLTKSDPSLFHTIVIDAGHGGHDGGCKGSGSNEKDVTLALALKLGELIREKSPEIKVVYTRDKDVFVPLYERAKIANQNNANLFISLHCNASTTKSVYGTETFVMGLHRSDANLLVAKRENSVMYLEDDYNKHYGDFDPNSLASIIEAAARQSAYLDQSISFASKVQEQFEKVTNQKNRGVKQAGFLVLYKTTMPAVLIETGFLTNLNEEKLLNSEEGQKDITRAIHQALLKFKEGIDKGSKPLLEEPVVKNNEKTSKEVAQKEEQKLIINNEEQEANTDEKANVQEKPELKAENKVNSESDHHTKSNKAVGKDVVFKVQIAASPTKLDMKKYPYSKIKPPVEEIFSGNLYKYVVGNYSTINAAQKEQNNLRNTGFKDAFVVAYHEGKRITVKEARNILQQ